MQAVILAAGKSTRTYPLALTRPKPLLKVANKTLLEHNLDSLNGIVDESIIVVGYKKNMIKKHIGSRYKNIKIKYVVQKQQLGTAHAVSLVESYVKGRFVLLMGDDIYSKEDIKKCIQYRYSILTTKAKNPQNFGVVLEKNRILANFVEKPKKFVSDTVSTAFYSLDRKIFKYIKQIKKSKRNEFEMPDAVRLLAKREKIHIVKSRKWLPIADAFDLLKADKELRKNKNCIGDNARIKGKVKNSSIGNGCIIKGNVKNSIIMDSAIIDKNSTVEDSIIGENAHFSGKITAKNSIGAVIGDNCELINVKINAGVKINPDSKIKNKAIRHDVK